MLRYIYVKLSLLLLLLFKPVGVMYDYNGLLHVVL